MSDHPIYIVLILAALVLAGFGSAAMALISMWEDLLNALRSHSGKGHGSSF